MDYLKVIPVGCRISIYYFEVQMKFSNTFSFVGKSGTRKNGRRNVAPTGIRQPF